MTKNVNGLMNALRQSINEAIMESNDVAAALAALRRTGKCPAFTIDITLQDVRAESADPQPASLHPEELALADADVEFLATLGIRDPRIPTQNLE